MANSTLLAGHSQVNRLEAYFRSDNIDLKSVPGSTINRLWNNIVSIIPDYEVSI